MLREMGGTRRGEEGDVARLPPAVEALVPSTLREDDSYREVLLALIEHDGRCSLSALTRTLVDEANWPPDAAGTNPYRRTYLALVREYVPVLAEFDALTYDEELGTVALLADLDLD